MQQNSVFYEANKYSIHAEQDCIRNCPDKNIIKKCTMILVKLYKEKVKLCHPCHKCIDIINKYKLKRLIVYYSSVSDA